METKIVLCYSDISAPWGYMPKKFFNNIKEALSFYDNMSEIEREYHSIRKMIFKSSGEIEYILVEDYWSDDLPF